MNILVTGATGFVGKAVVNQLLFNQLDVVATVRHTDSVLPLGAEKLVTGDFSDTFDWTSALKDTNAIIHCAARAHIMNDLSLDPLAEFRKMNRDATLNLARQAADAGVQRFIFISSIKVNGEETTGFQPHPCPLSERERAKNIFIETDHLIPADPYGLSKYEAEQGLLALAKEMGLEVVIIRPTLVYGSGVKGNFASLLKWSKKGIPLPFGAIHNQRSFVALDNLVSFITHCISHPKAANEVFLISDGEAISTSDLLRKVAKAFGRKSWLMPVPVGLMIFCAKLIGKGAVANRLFGSLLVDSSKARDLLGWKPVVTMDEQLKDMADDCLNKARL